MELVLFHAQRRVAQGAAAEALAQARRYLQQSGCAGAELLALDRHSARLVEIDFSQDDGVILKMLGVHSGAGKRARGRPRLGVQSREVSLLPRHWQWLSRQPGGASAALRRLIEEARRSPEAQLDEARQAVDRFLQTLAGDLPAYEEVLRQFYRAEYRRMSELMAPWPVDIRDQAEQLVARVRAMQTPA